MHQQQQQQQQGTARHGKPGGNDGSTIAYDARLHVFTLSTGLLQTAVSQDAIEPVRPPGQPSGRLSTTLRGPSINRTATRAGPTACLPGRTFVRPRRDRMLSGPESIRSSVRPVRRLQVRNSPTDRPAAIVTSMRAARRRNASYTIRDPAAVNAVALASDARSMREPFFLLSCRGWPDGPTDRQTDDCSIPTDCATVRRRSVY